MPTRREFFISCSTLAAMASLEPSIAWSAPFRARSIPLETITFSDFSACVNTAFNVSGVELELIAAKMLENPAAADPEKFSLLFKGEAGAGLRSAIHDFEHAGIGRFQMFISPVGAREPGSFYYEAVFNRVSPGDHHLASVNTAEERA